MHNDWVLGLLQIRYFSGVDFFTGEAWSVDEGFIVEVPACVTALLPAQQSDRVHACAHACLPAYLPAY